MYKKFCFILASYLGLGYAPKASGTVGSLFTLPLAAVAAYYYGTTGILALSAAAFVIGWIASIEVLKYTAHDPSLIVIDEVAGQSLSFVLLAEAMRGNWHCLTVLGVGFVLFRVFDILKPWPVGWADKKLCNAFGVMFDDILAGSYAAAVLWLINWWCNLFIIG